MNLNSVGWKGEVVRISNLYKMIPVNSIHINPGKSAEIIGHNEHMLCTMLLHLPIKSLFRFKLVSKQWRSLLSSSHFVSRYNLLHPPLLSGLFLVPKCWNEVEHNQIEYISLGQNQSNVPGFNFSNIKLLQSCNGLLLYSDQEGKHSVLNPITRESKLLPSSTTSSPYYSLVFDPTISPHYKIICVEETYHNKYKISMYLSNSNSWISISSNVPDFLAPRDIDFTSGIYCNGSIHWTKRTPRGLYFNVEKDTLSLMPECPRQEQYSCEYFGHSSGYLHCVFTMERLRYYELFEMKKDYSAWDFKCRIEINMEFNYQNPQFMYKCHVLSVFRGQNREVLEIIMSIPGEVIAYDCKKKTYRKMYESKLSAKDKKIWYGIYHVYECFESLYPV